MMIERQIFDKKVGDNSEVMCGGGCGRAASGDLPRTDLLIFLYSDALRYVNMNRLDVRTMLSVNQR